jgi:hypothetical protein
MNPKKNPDIKIFFCMRTLLFCRNREKQNKKIPNMNVCRKTGCGLPTGRPTYVFCEEHRKIGRKRTQNHRLKLKGVSETTTSASNISNEFSQTFSQHQRSEVTESKTDRIIHRNLDGTSITKETVTAVTKAEEVICSMTNTVKEIHSSSVQFYQQSITEKYKNALSNHDRIKYVTSKLKATDSPFDYRQETLFDSLQSMTLPELLEQEEQFLRRALESVSTLQDVLPLVPIHSALREMIVHVQKDYDLYMPYTEYSNVSTSDEVEEQVFRKGRLLQQERIREHFDNPEVHATELKRHFLFVDHSMIWFGERRMPTLQQMYTDMKKQEDTREEISTKHVQSLLDDPSWRPTQTISPSEEPRMKTALDLYDHMNDAIYTNCVFEQGSAWDAWKSKICEHYLLLKLLIGDTPEDVKMFPQSIRRGVSHRELMDSSFFELDFAFYNGRRTEDVGELSITMENSREITGVCIEMPLLLQKLQPVCDALVAAEIRRFKQDPAWSLVTPDNLIKRHLGSADSNITESIDKLLSGTYPEDGMTQKRLLDMVETVYMNHGQDGNPYNNAHYSRLADMLPASHKQRLDNNKSQNLPREMLQLMNSRQKKLKL